MTAQHSTAQHSTAQHSTAQHSTAQHSTAQHSTASDFDNQKQTVLDNIGKSNEIIELILNNLSLDIASNE